MTRCRLRLRRSCAHQQSRANYESEQQLHGYPPISISILFPIRATISKVRGLQPTKYCAYTACLEHPNFDQSRVHKSSLPSKGRTRKTFQRRKTALRASVEIWKNRTVDDAVSVSAGLASTNSTDSKISIAPDKEFDIKLAIRNYGPGEEYAWPYEAWKAVEKYNARIGLRIDVGRTVSAKVDPAEAIAKCRARLYDLRLTDFDSTEVSKKNADDPLPGLAGPAA